jgi:hypothetical protein
MMNLQPDHERRATPRSRCLKGARIVLSNGNSTLACRVRNRSENGLRLSADQTSLVPNAFTLVHDGETHGQLCKVTWRTPTELGAAVVAETELARTGLNQSKPLMRKLN